MRAVKDGVVRPFLETIKTYRFDPNWITASSGLFGLIGVAFSTQD